MSVIWGVRRERGAIVDSVDVETLGAHTGRYVDAPGLFYAKGRLGMGVQLRPTHERASIDRGLVSDDSGNVLAFDGRLDNASTLASDLGLSEKDCSDAVLALAGYLKWGENCLARFTGDWAISIWCAHRERLLLAVDHAGTRTLYYRWGKGVLLWSTYLETFAASPQSEKLSISYAASYLSGLPTESHTPYENISRVPPGSYVIFEDGYASHGTHWSPYQRKSLRYSSESEYDEHFLMSLGQAVARRTSKGAQILAQLSGGMDSTSIVCMSDHLRRSVDDASPLLDTISFYDGADADQTERNFFTLTESRRGKMGIHLNTAITLRTFESVQAGTGSYEFPGADSFSVTQEEKLHELIWQKGYRVILSGLGGDEVLGGVPTGLPELADLLISGSLITLLNQSTRWCLPERSPLLRLLLATSSHASRLYLKGTASNRTSPPWLSKRLMPAPTRRQDKNVLERLRFTPSQLDNADTWSFVLETLPHKRPQFLFRPEYRYPMLDKDLVEFLFSIPREQLVRPGRRRVMMRRALRGIVPNEILERRRKNFHLRAPLNGLQRAREKIERLWEAPLLGEAGLIDVHALRRESERCLMGAPDWHQALLRTVAFELWLRSKADQATFIH